MASEIGTVGTAAISGGALLAGVQLGRLLEKVDSPGMRVAAVAMSGGALLAGIQLWSHLRKADNSGSSSKSAGSVQTQIIDGKGIAAQVRADVKDAAAALQEEHGVKPGIAVVLVGERQDSQTYVQQKKKAAREVDFHSVDVKLPGTVTQEELIYEVQKLNADTKVHAILVQLPLPAHIDEATVLKEIKVEKDADGFAAVNIGNMCLKGGDPPLAVPCTPAGCVELLQRSDVDVQGKIAVVLGRSNIVGMPVAALLQSMDATVIVCHSRTKNLEEHVRRADIVVAALGKAEFVRGSWLKPGCVVLDVGINSVDDATQKVGYRLVGDVNFAEAQGVASHITPVPGGVGPMTIAMLLKNTLNLARHSLGLPRLPLRRTSTAAAPAPDSVSLSVAAPAAAAAGSLPSQDYAVMVSVPALTGDVWASAVEAGRLREQVQRAAGCDVLPAVVVEASAQSAGVQLVSLGPTGSRTSVASGATFDDIAAQIGGQ